MSSLDRILPFLRPIEDLLLDPTVTEVMVNGCSSIYVERAGKLYRTDERFDSDARLRQVIDKIVSAVGRRFVLSAFMGMIRRCAVRGARCVTVDRRP